MEEKNRVELETEEIVEVRIFRQGVPLVRCRARRFGPEAFLVATGPVAFRGGQWLEMEIGGVAHQAEFLPVYVVQHSAAGTLIKVRGDHRRSTEKVLRVTRRSRFLADARRLQERIVTLLRSSG